MKLKFLMIMLACFSMLAACTPLGILSPTETPTISVPGSKPTSAPTVIPTIEPGVTPTHLPVDLSPAERAAMQELSKKYNVPMDKIQLSKSEAVTWPNGCLGIVIPGVMCTQNQVEGFRVLLLAEGRQFEFHTNQDGSVVMDAAVQLALLRFVVYTSSHEIKVVEPANIALGATYNPAFNGLFPTGSATAGTAYVLDFTSGAKAVAVDVNGSHDLSFIQNPSYGLALWRGGPGAQPRLAWGTQLDSSHPSTLQVSNTDGSQLETLLTADANATPPQQFVAEFWSADGTSLYFSKEPVGIGGYIPFAGASSLYQIDLASKQVKELIPFNPSSSMSCLDAISGDYQFVADHCTAKVITIRDLASGAASTIQPPAEVTDFGQMGSARFSPDGSRVAFALAKGDPSDEQGWIAVSDGKSGASKMILVGDESAYLSVLGWLDDQTLLFQTNPLQCSNNVCTNTLWTVKADGSNPTQVAEGSLLAILDNQ